MSDSSDQQSGSTFQRLRSDLIAGLVNAVASLPSGMATATMAGVNPVFGLYAVTVAPAVGGLLASSQLMQIATNGAAALTASEGISGYSGDERNNVLFLLVAIAGILLILFGLLKAGRLLRYISFPVMIAFLSGVAVVLILDQTAQLVGYQSEAKTSLGKFIDLLVHPQDISLRSAAVGVFALAIILGLNRTPLSSLSSLAGLAIPTTIVAFWKPAGVRLVSDISDIPRGLPPLGLPDVTLITPGLLLSGFALAVIIAIQGAGISESYSNPDGSKANPSRDMFAQGAANVLGSLVSGMPTGGSVGQTALNVSVGAKSRFAGVFHGGFMLLFILLVPGLVSLVPLPVLASVMIVAGFSAIRVNAIKFVWRADTPARWVLAVTFLATLVLSIAAAVAVGFGLAVVLYLYSSASHVTVSALEPSDEGIKVVEVPKKLPERSITVLDVYGSLFFAAARRLRELLPDPSGSERPVVILRLRGNSQVGVTSIDVLNGYAKELAKVGGRLYLCGMREEVSDRLKRSDRFRLDKEVALFPSTGILRDSTRSAIAAGNDYLRHYREDGGDTLTWPE